MKKLIAILSLALLLFAGGANAGFSGGFSSPNYWKLSANILSPINSTWTVNIPTLTVGAITMSDNLDMDGNCILLDGDGNSFICAPSDNQIEFSINGASTTVMDTNGFNFQTKIRISQDLDISSSTTLTTNSDLSFTIDTFSTNNAIYITDAGNVGFGIGHASGTINFANNAWVGADSQDGVNFVNWFNQSSTTDNILVGSSLQFGSYIELADDSIQVFADLPVTDALNDGDPISGALQIDGNNVFTWYGLADGSGGADTFSVKIGASTSTTLSTLLNGNFTFATATTSNALVITNGGNVGIGTTNPLSALHVNSSVANVNVLIQGYTVESDTVSVDAGSVQLGGNANNHGLLDYTPAGATTLVLANTFNNDAAKIIFKMKNSLDVMTLLGNGNVGIGTTTPSTKLQVEGIIRSLGGNFGFAHVTRKATNTQAIASGGVAQEVLWGKVLDEHGDWSVDDLIQTPTSTIPNTGTYSMTYCFQPELASGANQIFEYALFNNGVQEEYSGGQRYISSSNDIGSTCRSYHSTYTSGDELTIKISGSNTNIQIIATSSVFTTMPTGSWVIEQVETAI